MNPHLARPIIAKQEGALIDPGSSEERLPERPPTGPGNGQSGHLTPAPVIIDPQEELRRKKARIESIMKTSTICKNVLAMGFSHGAVQRALEERIDAATEANPELIYESTIALLDDVVKKEGEIQREAEEKEAANEASMMSSIASGLSGKYNVSFLDEDESSSDPCNGLSTSLSMGGSM